MKSCIYFLVVCLLLGSVPLCFAQTPDSTAVGAAPAASATTSAFPYVAEITGSDVFVRSGPGTNYYNCGKINKGDKVKVVRTQFSWSCIVPPPGSFSWISMRSVGIDYEDPNIGIVKEDNVRVFAGSDRVRPIHSTSLQGKMDSGEKVKLLGEQKENYYKIEPPAFAYLWVSTNFTKPYVPPIEVPEVPDTPTETDKPDETQPVGPVTPAVEPNQTEPVRPVVPDTVKPVQPVTPPALTSIEARKLVEYRELARQIKAEQAKPMQQQDYSQIKRALLEIANNKNAGKAARYSEHVIKQIERFELAFAIAKQIQLQEVQSKKVQEDIEEAREANLAKVKDLGKFAVTGTLKSSSIYGSNALKYYRVLDSSGKTVCYAASSSVDAAKFVGKEVGLVGTIEPHPQTGTALVKFTKIVEIE